MFFEDKKSVLSRALAGGIIGLVVFIPLGGLFNDLVNGGLITMGPHTPFRLVSADLDELLRLSDRLLTIYEGRITGEFQAGDIDKREISYYMTGGRKEEQA